MKPTHVRLAAVTLLLAGGIACSSDDLTNPFAPMGLGLTFNQNVDTLFLTDSGVPAPVHLTLSATSFGQAVPTPTGVEWTIEDSTIATVDSTGGLRPLRLGSTTVTARINDAKAHAQVIVAHKVAGVVVAPNPIAAFVGDTASIVASAIDANGALVTGTAYTFSVSDPTIIALTRTSTRTATAIFLKAGTARINVVADGFTGSTTATVR